MRRQFHQGYCKTLNLYVHNWLPVQRRMLTRNGRRDEAKELENGCIVRSNRWDDIQTPTHEVCHWLGIFHTFHGEPSGVCGPNNDLVDDTPATRQLWSYNITDERSSNLRGTGPVTNMMSHGSCAAEFTPGERRRMVGM